jgi:organic hydroperoxide reductase OsmC/OhrA
MDTIKPLFTATATATGGRNGHTQANDGSVSADLSVPKAMGGPGKPGTTTPEHLFAAGYAACFAEHSTSSASSTRRMPVKPASPPTYRSDRATAAASGWR